MTDKAFVKKSDIVGKVDDHFFNMIDKKLYEYNEIEPVKLITHNRLDLAIKVLFLQMLPHHTTFCRNLYASHLRCFSLGSFKEPGNEAKNSLKRYVDEFLNLYDAFKHQPFDIEKSFIPLAMDKTIANGAHRVSAAYVAKRKVATVALDIHSAEYDYRFFRNRGMDSSDIEAAVCKFVELCPNSYIAILWPSAAAMGKDNEVNRLFSRVIYKKAVRLNYTGTHNLIAQVYANESWLGKRDQNYRGVEGKLVPCFKANVPLRVMAFQADSQVQRIKTGVRELFGMGKHSIHITDTHEEAIRVARLLFNNNAIHFLNNARPNRYTSTFEKLKEFKEFIRSCGYSANDVLLDSSNVLSLYGLREARDIDYIAVSGKKTLEGKIHPHNSELRYHGEEKDDLIFNPRFHFYYEGIKFVAFWQLYRMKKARGEEKDLNDLLMMDALVEKKMVAAFLAKMKQEGFYLRAKVRKSIVEVTKRVGCYRSARTVYRKLKGRHEG